MPVTACENIGILETSTREWLAACIRNFDKGLRQIYLTGADGRFLKKAVTPDSFRAGCSSGLFTVPCLSAEVGEETWRENIDLLWEELSKQQPGCAEYLVTIHDRPRFAISIQKNEKQDTACRNWECISYDKIRDFCLQENIHRIYLSSMASKDAIDFYRRFAPSLPLRLLDKAHLKDALAGEHSMLVCSADIFPAHTTGRKYSWPDLWKALTETPPEPLGRGVFIKKSYAVVPATYSGVQNYIEAFDSGSRYVYLEDSEGHFQGMIEQSHVRNCFLSHDFHPIRPSGTPWQADRKALCEDADRRMREQNIPELPVLDSNKIRAIATKLRRRHQEEMVRWKMISKAVFLDFLSGARRCLISSNAGTLDGFREQFQDCAEIMVFRDEDLDAYYSGDYDLLVCGSNIWPRAMTRCYAADELFLDLLGETVRRWLEQQGISYFSVNTDATPNMDYQTTLSSYLSPLFHNRVMDGHYVSGDMEEDGIHIKDGIRQTTDVPEQWSHSIYMTGTCQCIGMSARDEETIPSCLQRHLNRNGTPYRVVNCTGAFALIDTYSDWYGGISHDINSLYRIMHMDLKSGDIVVQFCSHAWRIDAPFALSPMRHCFLKEHFGTARRRSGKYFIDPYSTSHMTPEGYEEASQAILKHLEPILEHGVIPSAIRPFPYCKKESF